MQGTELSKLGYWGKGFDKDHRATEVTSWFVEHALAINEVHVNTIEGLWTTTRNFLRPFRGVHKKNLQYYLEGRTRYKHVPLNGNG